MLRGEAVSDETRVDLRGEPREEDQADGSPLLFILASADSPGSVEKPPVGAAPVKATRGDAALRADSDLAGIVLPSGCTGPALLESLSDTAAFRRHAYQ